jgi:cytochrome c oxidase assembly protein subunit 15
VIVIATIVATLALAWRINTRREERRMLADAASLWLLAGVLQALIGYVQYLNDLPELLVGIHVGGAAAVTLATTHLVLRAHPAVADGSTLRTLEVGAAAT